MRNKCLFIWLHTLDSYLLHMSELPHQDSCIIHQEINKQPTLAMSSQVRKIPRSALEFNGFFLGPLNESKPAFLNNPTIQQTESFTSLVDGMTDNVWMYK